MKFVIFGFMALYLGVLVYVYLTQDSKVFNQDEIEPKELLELKNTQRISLKVGKNVVLDGVYKKSLNQNAPLIIYFGGNADDATRIVLHVKSLVEYDVLAFNYRGFVNSSGKPSEKNIFSDALSIFDEYGKDKDVIVMGRSLGTGTATYLASKRDVKGLILITPYDSVVSMAKKMYPYLPVKILSKHKFDSVKHMYDVKAKVGLIEVIDDETISAYHFDKLKQSVLNQALHIELENTTHKDVLIHPQFEESLKKIIKEFNVDR